jgi:hypothetical protein
MIRGADSAARDSVDMKLIGQLRRDVVIHMCCQIAADPEDGSAASTPVQNSSLMVDSTVMKRTWCGEGWRHDA